MPRGANRAILALPSLPRPRRRRRRRRSQSQRAKGLFFRARPLSLAPVIPLARRLARQRCPMLVVRTGESASAGFAREAIGRTSSPPAICNPRGLILRGNDNLGTIRPPPPPPALLVLSRFQRCRPSWISVRALALEFFSGRSVE